MRSIAARLEDGWQRAADPAWLEGWVERDFELPGGFTRLVVMGEGPPLLLVPPLPGFKEAFVACAFRLARRFPVVTYDLRSEFDGRPRWGALLYDLRRVADARTPRPSAGRPAADRLPDARDRGRARVDLLPRRCRGAGAPHPARAAGLVPGRGASPPALQRGVVRAGGRPLAFRGDRP